MGPGTTSYAPPWVVGALVSAQLPGPVAMDVSNASLLDLEQGRPFRSGFLAASTPGMLRRPSSDGDEPRLRTPGDALLQYCMLYFSSPVCSPLSDESPLSTPTAV